MQYQIIFAGEVLPGHQVYAVKQQFIQRMKLTPEQADKLFSGKPITIKKGLDEAAAWKYLNGMTKIGALVKVDPPLPDQQETLELEPMEEAPPAATTADATPAPGGKPDEHNPYQPPKETAKSLFCRSCGARVGPRQAKCRACGADQELGKPRNKYVAAILAVLLGWIGAHRIYLGQWWGLLYLLLYVVMWPVAIIEALVFLFTPKARWEEKYGNVQGSGAVVIVVLLFVGVAIVGILAAIAIPAYQDYTVRARVAQAIEETGAYRERVETYYARTGQAPAANEDIGIDDAVQSPAVAGLSVGPNGVLTVWLQGHTYLAGQNLIWTPDFSSGHVAWRCDGGTLQNKYRPAKCRYEAEQGSAAESGGLREIRSSSGRVSLQLPAGPWKAEDPEGAELLYINEQEDIGIIVVRESKQDFGPGVDVDGFTNLLIENAFTDFSDTKFERYGKHDINGRPGRLFSFSGLSNSVVVEGLVAAVEGKDDYYKVMAWTAKSRFDLKYSKLLALLESFEEHPR